MEACAIAEFIASSDSLVISEEQNIELVRKNFVDFMKEWETKGDEFFEEMANVFFMGDCFELLSYVAHQWVAFFSM